MLSPRLTRFALLMLHALPALAQNTAPAELPRVEVTGRHYDNQIGSSDAASQGSVRAELLQSRPALRPGEVLEFVPGVIVTQHSGDGKANQYFLRGFNLDHGTDFATQVDGMPVNMPSHGHGQGYSDLNFLIPELVERIDYRKGPYFANQGDFASAGAADIHYRRHLEAPLVQLSGGENGYRRAVLAGSTVATPGDSGRWTGALELMHNDGPWTVPEDLHRSNAVLRYEAGQRDQGWGVSAMAYGARWTATDQVPQRLIDAGQYQGQPFGRFDSLDPSDGGNTQRLSLSGHWQQRQGDSGRELQAYVMRYALKLFSNFSYALERPDSGDQFSQQDRRTVAGLQARQHWNHLLGGMEARSELGVALRHDAARVGLFDTQERRILSTTREDDIRQTQLGVYGHTQLVLAPWLRSVVGLRADVARFEVDSVQAVAGEAARAANSGQASDSQFSPKLSVVAGPWAKTEVFANAGRGFHSNDARGTTTRVDPRSGEAVQPVPALVASRGWELGLRTEALPGLQSSLALWWLNFDSELVYVGDAGATEESGASRRHGVEWNNRWTPDRRFLLDADLAWTHARFANGDHIPNAVDQVASVAATFNPQGRWSASVQWRFLGAGALIEDNSVRSQTSSTLNLRLGHRWERVGGWTPALSLDVFNLGNRRVNDIQYFYGSQLPGESAPVADRVVHPAEPRTLRLTLRMEG